MPGGTLFYLRGQDITGHWSAVIGYALLFAAVLVAVTASRVPPLNRLRSRARLHRSAVKRGGLVFCGEGVLLIVLFAVVGPYTPAESLLHGPLFIALCLLGFGAYVQQEHRRGGPQDSKACARCKYPRPAERARHSEVCSECGNKWWDTPWHDGLRVWDRTDRHGTRTLRSVKRKRDTHILMRVAIVLFAVIVGGEFAMRFGAVQQHLPTPVVQWLSLHPDDHVSGEAVGTLLRERQLSQEEADALLNQLIEERRRPSDAITNAGESLEDAIGRGVFSSALLDRFFSESIEYTLQARLSADGRTVEPVIEMRAWARTIEFKPYVVSPGLRINDGSWSQPLVNPQRASEIAQSYADYWLLSGYGSRPETHEWRAQMGG